MRLFVILAMAAAWISSPNSPASAQHVFCYDYDAEGRIETATRNDGSQLDYGFVDSGSAITDRNDNRETLNISTTATANCSAPTGTGSGISGGNDPEPVNYAPVAVNDGGNVFFGQSVTILVLANDTEPNGQPLTIYSFTQPSEGSVQTSGAGLQYTAPSSSNNITATFTYTITDGTGLYDTATVTVSFLGGP